MAGTFITSGGPPHAQDSLPALPAHLQSDTHITAHLASRFHVSLPTANLSSQAIVSLNTYSSPSKGGNGSNEGSAAAAMEDLAARSFTRLAARSEDQAVIFLGESGAGKTTLRSHLLSSLLNASSTPLSTKLSYAAFVFDTLTTTKSVTTPTASKAGLFYELQYETTTSTHPTLIGGKMLDHRLERSRIASVPTGERSFHALYYLLAGTSAAEKHHLGLDTAIQGAVDTVSSHKHNTHITGQAQKRWRYLGHPTQLKVGINDAEGFQHFKDALRKLEFPRAEIAEICQILASILHIGQLEFETTQDTTPSADDSGGFSHEGGQTVTSVKNKEHLEIVAAFLGVRMEDLEHCFGYKTRTIHKERVTVMLDPRGARDNADELARTLYSLLVTWILEQINQKVCAAEDAVGNTISIVDFPGFAPQSATGSTLDQLLNNAATESLHHLTLQNFFDRKEELLETEEVVIPPTRYYDNTDAFKALCKPGNGLLAILDDQMRRGKTDAQFHESIRKRFQDKNPAVDVSEATSTLPGSNFATQNPHSSFTVRHYAGQVEYPVDGLLEENAEIVSGDLMNLVQSTKSDFVRTLFGQESIEKVYHPLEKTAIVQASLSSKPSRKPSVARRVGRLGERRTRNEERKTLGRKGKAESAASQGASAGFLSALDSITNTISSPNMNSYFVFCLKPNDRRIANQFDSKCVRTQIQTLGIAEISQRLRNADFSVFVPFSEFLGLNDAEHLVIGSEREKSEHILDDKQWPLNEARIGSTGVLLSERCWRIMAKISQGTIPRSTSTAGPRAHVENSLQSPDRKEFADSKAHLLGGPSPYNDDKMGSYFGSREVDTKSDTGASAFNQGDMFRGMDSRDKMAEKGNELKMEEVDTIPMSGSRKRWLVLVYLLTWYIPDFAIKWFGRIKRKDVRKAWREKLAINLMIWFSCAVVIFFIIFFPALICPKQHVFTQQELSGYNGQGGADSYVAIRGVVIDFGKFMPNHYPSIIPQTTLQKYAGRDVTPLFPIQVSSMCQGTNPPINQAVQLGQQGSNYTGVNIVTSTSDINAQYHDFRWGRGDGDYRPGWFTEQMLFLEKNYYKGNVGYTPQYMTTLAQKQSRYIGSILGRVYDFTQYVQGGNQPNFPPGYNGTRAPGDINTPYMDNDLVQLFVNHKGTDLTQAWLALNYNNDFRANMLGCMNNLFYVGNVDTRNSPQCQFARYILLAISILLVAVIGVKFLAALQFGGKNIPENLDKFIMITIPAYTEDEESLRRAIDSAARMKYDDKRKLLVVVCDGMIIGQGNDRPTPRIVLDILGVPDTVDPEPLSFESLGEGMKQHNMGKVYSGLYEVQGHIVPFLVIVKVGKPSEVSRPGNRGKRDSQMILMRFLNRVHYNYSMTPLELEMHHQIRNVIGVNPTFYEYMLQIDADTVVAPDSASRFVSAFLHDTRLIAVCGETSLSNAKASFVTMMQVYEYYISHNLTKAFESLFGSVTCLPGCFSMFRIRAADSGKPLFVSKDVVEAYSDIRVDTLHMKNLLHLGEDRYLTTLLLKFHGRYKTKYVFRAHAWTIAPDSWKVFLSQRRRWINSTVHNLLELIPLQQLCGFCCFSMRFVVFLDLLSTIVQPVIVGYIVYLIVLLATHATTVPITAFILLGAIYGLQAIIFILRRKWEMVGWMIIYMLATPIFAFGLPLYSFWHMDDFSWGNTRVVMGEKGRQIVVSDEGKFDPSTIPRKKWQDYQAELWEAQTTHGDDLDDARSQYSGISYATKSAWNGGMGAKSEYARSEFGFGAGGQYPGSRPTSAMHNPFNQGMTRSSSNLNLAASRPGSMAGYEMSEMSASHLPSDDALLAEIRDILNKADLMQVTKKSIFLELERRFGMNLSAKRAYISSATESVLSGQL